ncbi:MAG TPA: CHAP domain-containing protein [Candidatus Limnocylindrales bacterium]|nr:CHAP domain-containing protein [Candidatus Limnocylindrales bacterium]
MKLVLASLLLLAFPALVGSAAAATAAAPRPAPAVELFAWVPAGGFPDRFPFGQCTWWAAYNRRVTWNGNAGDWLSNAQAEGIATSDVPSIGAIAVYRPGGDYSVYGHVAIVIGVSPRSYTVSEMNAVGWGQVSTRTLPWPDRQAQGFIPLSASEAR